MATDTIHCIDCKKPFQNLNIYSGETETTHIKDYFNNGIIYFSKHVYYCIECLKKRIKSELDALKEGILYPIVLASQTEISELEGDGTYIVIDANNEKQQKSIGISLAADETDWEYFEEEKDQECGLHFEYTEKSDNKTTISMEFGIFTITVVVNKWDQLQIHLTYCYHQQNLTEFVIPIINAIVEPRITMLKTLFRETWERIQQAERNEQQAILEKEKKTKKEPSILPTPLEKAQSISKTILDECNGLMNFHFKTELETYITDPQIKQILEKQYKALQQIIKRQQRIQKLLEKKKNL